MLVRSLAREGRGPPPKHAKACEWCLRWTKRHDTKRDRMTQTRRGTPLGPSTRYQPPHVASGSSARPLAGCIDGTGWYHWVTGGGGLEEADLAERVRRASGWEGVACENRDHDHNRIRFDCGVQQDTTRPQYTSTALMKVPKICNETPVDTGTGATLVSPPKPNDSFSRDSTSKRPLQ